MYRIKVQVIMQISIEDIRFEIRGGKRISVSFFKNSHCIVIVFYPSYFAAIAIRVNSRLQSQYLAS